MDVTYHTRRITYSVVLALATAAIALACTGGDSSTPDIQPFPTPTSTTASTATPDIDNWVQTAISDPLRGGELTQLWIEPLTLDPILAGNTASTGIIIELFSGLVTIDKDLNVVSDIAERWTKSDDDLTYTFYLSENVRFHDGKSVTAHDFNYSLERALDPIAQSPTAGIYLGDIVGAQDRLSGIASEVQGIQVLDNYTLQITVDQPKPYFLAKLTHPTAFVVDKETIESGLDSISRANGTGPFKLAKWEEGELIRLERNDLFYNGPPHLDAVNFVLSGGVEMIMYENEEIDVTSVGLADIERVLDTSERLSKELVISPNTFGIQYFGMDINTPPFNDINVRLALNYVIDKERIAEQLLSGMVSPAYGILPPGFPGYNPGFRGLRFDAERAMRLMAESSYGMGDPEIIDLLEKADQETDLVERLSLLNRASEKAAGNLPPIQLFVPGGVGGVGLGTEMIIEMWRRNLGVDVQIPELDSDEDSPAAQPEAARLLLMAWFAYYPDPHGFLDVLFHSQGPANIINYSNMKVDQILEQARTEQDPVVRITLYRQVEDILVNDAPWVPTWFSGNRYALIKPYVKGYTLTPIPTAKLKDVYISKD